MSSPETNYPGANRQIGAYLTPPVPSEASVSASLAALERAVQAHDSLLNDLETRLVVLRVPHPQAPANEKPLIAPNSQVVVQIDDVAAYVRRQSDRLECLLSELQL